MSKDNIIEVDTTPSGYTIFKSKNEQIGGYDYYSNSCSGGVKIVDAIVSVDELDVVLSDLKKSINGSGIVYDAELAAIEDTIKYLELHSGASYDDLVKNLSWYWKKTKEHRPHGWVLEWLKMFE